MVFQRQRIHGAVCELLVLKRCWVECVVLVILCQEFLHIHQFSGIHQFLAVWVGINIDDVRHISSGDQCL
ncbi:hypothetical protein SDC9_183406 [bioreactor metagenome]|uniref:Uncharacterized protein n=1 Tax=bioreactor metagenome TaxID=1076179 RepID=A0A645HJT1_9ZZZZ